MRGNQTSYPVGVAEVSWADGSGGVYGPVGGTQMVSVREASVLSISKWTDTDPDAPTGELGYQMLVTNDGSEPLTGVAVDDPIDAHTPLVPGSLSATTGAVTSGSNAGDAAVSVDVGTLAPGAAVTVTFSVTTAGVPAVMIGW